MPQPSARERFFALLRTSLAESAFVKLTLGKHRGRDTTLNNLFIRPVVLKTGPQLTFVYRHATRDITKNLSHAEAIALLEKLTGSDFRDAHLFTTAQTVQLTTADDGTARISIKLTKPAPAAATPSISPLPPPTFAPLASSRDPASSVSSVPQPSTLNSQLPPPAPTPSHNRTRTYLIPADAPWLRALGVTNDRGQPREGMAPKFRQINKFVELLSHLVTEAGLLADDASAPLQIADMGSGKGYLTFATAAHFGARAKVTGIEARPDLVALCNRVAAENNLSNLAFSPGSIAATPLASTDVLVALHACDTATDDALAKGIQSGATLLVVSPCCQKELRPQLTAPAVLADALKHGIFQERQAEFVTDALRAQLLEWAGYRAKVFEFVSTEHTAKNLLIAAIKVRDRGTVSDPAAGKIRAFAQFYGIGHHQLATHLGFTF